MTHEALILETCSRLGIARLQDWFGLPNLDQIAHLAHARNTVGNRYTRKKNASPTKHAETLARIEAARRKVSNADQ